jgi:hypothetical protein
MVNCAAELPTESDPTVLDSVRDGVTWSEPWGIYLPVFWAGGGGNRQRQ